MNFAPDYVSLVLNENFEDAVTLFLAPLMALHQAHLVMLADRGIVSPADARALRNALEAIPLDEVRRTVFDGRDEDLFCHINRRLVDAVGEEVAGRLHTARSRNDIDMVLYRMRQREWLLALLEATLRLRGTLVEVAEANTHTVFPAHTHTQPAQPSTIAHYLLAVIEQLERDGVRLRAAFETTNRCPLGACAITGTGFAIDRDLTADLLGFAGPTGNTYGSIASVDYLLQGMSAAIVTLTGFGRFVQDLLQWCTMEFGYVRLADGFVQPSSIMPQKRNPVAIEHARSIASRAFGQAMGVIMAVHNTPFGDIVDTEDDLQPLVFSAYSDSTRAVALVAAALRGAEFDRGRLAARAALGGITLTELADVLAREHDVPFQLAHRVVARLMAVSRAQPERRLAPILREVALEVTGREVSYGDDELAELLSPRHFVDVRRTLGGPAPEMTTQALAASRALLAGDEGWLAETRRALNGAERRLAERRMAL
jgi:argininosuccinate lyase